MASLYCRSKLYPTLDLAFLCLKHNKHNDKSQHFTIAITNPIFNIRSLTLLDSTKLLKCYILMLKISILCDERIMKRFSRVFTKMLNIGKNKYIKSRRGVGLSNTIVGL